MAYEQTPYVPFFEKSAEDVKFTDHFKYHIIDNFDEMCKIMDVSTDFSKIKHEPLVRDMMTFTWTWDLSQGQLSLGDFTNVNALFDLS